MDDVKVQLRIFETLITVESDEKGNLTIGGDRQDIAAIAERYLHENAIVRGRFLQNRLKAADRLARRFKGKVVGRDKIVAVFRRGWIQLFSENLMPERDSRLERFMTMRWIHVSVRAKRRHASCGGPIYSADFDASQMDLLVITRQGRDWKIRWEDISEITFKYYQPPPEWVSERRSIRKKRRQLRTA